MDQQLAKGRGLRLSLLWKLLLPSVLILAVIAGSMAWQSWQQINTQLQNQTIEQLRGDQRILTNLFEQLRQEYGHIGNELSAAFESGGEPAMVDYIEQSADLFARLNWVAMHASGGAQVASWSAAGLDIEVTEAQSEALLQQASRELQPVGRIHCQRACEYLVAMPVGREAEIRTLLLAVPVLDVLPAYDALTGGDIVLFRTGAAGTARASLAQSVQNLAQAVELAWMAQLPAGATGERKFLNRAFAYLLSPLEQAGGADSPVSALLLRDLTPRLVEARRQSLQQLGLDVLVMLVGGFGLFWILSRNLTRLRRVTQVLPMLSELGRYQQARDELRRASPEGLARDEVDALRATLEWLSERLEQLHGAEAASEAKSRFLATMSHEIRTPMSGILGLTEILARQQLSPDQRRMAVMIHESTVNLLSIINDVLDYSRIEAGAAELDPVDFDPAHLLESVADMVAVNALRKNLRLRVLYPQELPALVSGDEGKIRQVLLNLLSNALKFTDSGSVTLQLDCHELAGGMCEMDFTVRDTGIGISADAQQKIFQRFSQADSTTTRKFGGTGLGLAICDGLARVMGGRIDLDSTPGEGAQFQLRLAVPLVVEAVECESLLRGYRVQLRVDAQERACWSQHLQRAGASIVDDDDPSAGGVFVQIANASDDNMTRLYCQRRANGETQKAEVDRPVKPSDLIELVSQLRLASGGDDWSMASGPAVHLGLRALIVEDQPVNRDLLARQLAQLGCEAVEAADGVAALEVLEADDRFDLLITDLHMPKLDGYGLVQAIQRGSNPALRGLPVVVLTASASREDLPRLHKLGIARKLVKPVRLVDLQDCLRGLQLAPAEEQAGEVVDSGPSVQADADYPVLDVELLHEILGDDLSGLSRYAEAFRQSTGSLVPACRQALQAGDVEEVQRLLHRAKGSSRSLGGLRLAWHLEQTEETLRQGGQADAALDEIEAAHAEFTQALDALAQAA